jgi:hypothetical protein
MNWQDKLTTVFLHIVMVWGMLIFLGALSALTAVSIKLTYNILVK